MMRRVYWLALLLLVTVLMACSAETAPESAAATIAPTANPPTDVPATAIPPTDTPPTDIPATAVATTIVEATEAPTEVAATEAPAATDEAAAEEVTEPVDNGETYNGYVYVKYTQDNADLVGAGERLQFVNVYATW